MFPEETTLHATNPSSLHHQQYVSEVLGEDECNELIVSSGNTRQR